MTDILPETLEIPLRTSLRSELPPREAVLSAVEIASPTDPSTRYGTDGGSPPLESLAWSLYRLLVRRRSRLRPNSPGRTVRGIG
jgi:hypothetical protein